MPIDKLKTKIKNKAAKRKIHLKRLEYIKDSDIYSDVLWVWCHDIRVIDRVIAQRNNTCAVDGGELMTVVELHYKFMRGLKEYDSLIREFEFAVINNSPNYKLNVFEIEKKLIQQVSTLNRQRAVLEDLVDIRAGFLD